MPPVPAMILTTSKDGVLPPHRSGSPFITPEQKDRFLRIINGKAIIVGRKTFFQFRTMLPKCWIIILSQDQDFLEEGSYRDYQGYGYWFVENLTTAHTFAEGLAQQHGQSEYFIIGGIEIFEQTADSVNRLYLTTLHHKTGGTPFTQQLNLEEWGSGLNL